MYPTYTHPRLWARQEKEGQPDHHGGASGWRSLAPIPSVLLDPVSGPVLGVILLLGPPKGPLVWGVPDPAGRTQAYALSELAAGSHPGLRGEELRTLASPTTGPRSPPRV